MKRMVLATFVICALLALPQLFKRMTEGFRLEKIILTTETYPNCHVQAVSAEEMREIHRVLDQPFTYLARGSQAFVFASRDGRYVLKLFRQPHMLHPWREWVRTQVSHKPPRASGEEKVRRVLAAAKLAFEKARDCTGVVYVHLNPTEDELSSVRLRDRLGKTHRLDLNRARFALQRRATPIREALSVLLEQQDVPGVRALFQSFAELICARTSKGIRNGDVSVYRNFGCLGNQVIEWDFGNYEIDAALDEGAELQRFAPPLRIFLAKHAPQWINEYEMVLRDAAGSRAEHTRPAPDARVLSRAVPCVSARE